MRFPSVASASWTAGRAHRAPEDGLSGIACTRCGVRFTLCLSPGITTETLAETMRGAPDFDPVDRAWRLDVGHGAARNPTMLAAASRPSFTAVTTRSAPRTPSPPAKIFGFAVW